jgi:hypothetical protein
MKGLQMLIYNKRYRVEAIKTSEEILNILNEEVISGNVNIMVKEHNVLYKRKKEYFIGKIEKDHFLLTKIYRTGRNIFAPIISGTIIKGEKTIIDLVFKTQLIIKLFLAILLLYSAYTFIEVIVLNERDVFQLICIVIFSIVLYMIYVFYYMKQVNEIRTFLEKIML